ncbi:MAG: hypothetical protein IVW51_08435 [Thermaceae bacterium]|nr:hypothetical protein [Thermaceae bacterium]
MKPRLDPRTHVQHTFQQGESSPPPFRPVAEVWPDLAQQPRLVLGIRATVVEVHTLHQSFGQPKPIREPLRLIHQAGGSQGQPHLFWVTELRPRAQTQTGLKKLAQYCAAHREADTAGATAALPNPVAGIPGGGVQPQLRRPGGGDLSS